MMYDSEWGDYAVYVTTNHRPILCLYHTFTEFLQWYLDTYGSAPLIVNVQILSEESVSVLYDILKKKGQIFE